MSREKFKLYFHCGAGKTGTSSIQNALRLGRDELKKHNVQYWGLMLEFAPVKKYDWQVASESKRFLKLNVVEALVQVEEVVRESIAIAVKEGVEAAVWSNELFFGRHDTVLGALKKMEREGLSIDVIMYLRRHDAWAKSAYVQWGIKHKTYSGKVKTFKEYIKERPVRFFDSVKPWVDAFDRNFYLCNFDEIQDVVSHFLSIISMDGKVRSCRVNETPTPEELVLRKLFNDRVAGEAMPSRFDQLVGSRTIDAGLDIANIIDELMPTSDDLEMVSVDSKEDRRLVNEVLEKFNQKPLKSDRLIVQNAEFSHEMMLGYLAQIVINQGVKIESLQKQLQDLAGKNKS